MSQNELKKSRTAKAAEILKMKQRLALMQEPGMEFYLDHAMVYNLRLAILQAEDELSELMEMRPKEFSNSKNSELW